MSYGNGEDKGGVGSECDYYSSFFLPLVKISNEQIATSLEMLVKAKVLLREARVVFKMPRCRCIREVDAR